MTNATPPGTENDTSVTPGGVPHDAPVATVRGQIPVRGVCRNGHTTTATSAKGRVTWEGPCSSAGCGLTVKARRVPAGADPAPAAEPTPEKPAAKGRFTPVEVTYAKPADRPADRPADPEQHDERPDPERPEQPGPGDSPAVDMGTGEHHSRQQARRSSGRFKRRRPKLTKQQRADARAAVDAEWIVPGILHR